MKFLRNLTLSLTLALCTCLSGQGAPAREGKILLKQPDGTKFHAIIRGDEFIRILTTIDGHSIIKEEDGFYCYATYGADGAKKSTGVRVACPGAGDIPAASKYIPFDILASNASARRSGVRFKESPIQRMNRRHVISKGGDAPVVKHGIVILAAFSDVPFKYTKGDFEMLLSQEGYDKNGATGCAKDYFNAQFKGKYEFSFEVSDIVTLSKSRAYYGKNDAGGNDSRPEEMILEACRLADNTIDFSKFDDDGDGEVDNVFVFFAGGDEAQNGDEDCIWSHAWYLVDGAGMPSKDVTFDGVIVNRYACSAELTTRTSEEQEDILTGIGTFCHEYSHTFGLPDLYDTDYDKSGGKADALWRYTSLMDGGNYNNFGNTPPYYNAIELEILGMEHEEIAMGAYELSPIGDGGKAYRIDCDTPDEYYLVEYRDNKGWDKYIQGSGLLIYHIDKSDNMTGQSDSYGKELKANERWEFNEINANPAFQCADLIEARQGIHFSNGNTRDIFFPYQDVTSFQPSFRDGSKSELIIDDIRIKDGKAMLSIRNNLFAQGISCEAFQDCAIISWKSKDGTGGTSTLRYGTGNDLHTITVAPYSEDGRYSATLEGLIPGTSNKVEISVGENGAWTSFSFVTKKYKEGSYPFIFLKNVKRNSDGTFEKGAELPLRLYNAIGAVSTTWSLDGEEISTSGNGYYKVEKGGVLKAVANYEDGSTDTVIKEITVR